jgi:RNA polymerase sigma-70 factor (ECF subfamily)
VRDCLHAERPGPYQIQAAIGAVHADAPSHAHTDWPQILTLYDHLYALHPSPIVALNRAVAIAETHGPAAALKVITQLKLDDYQYYHAVRADLLRRLSRYTEAADAYHAAITRTSNAAERRFLEARLRQLPSHPQ